MEKQIIATKECVDLLREEIKFAKSKLENAKHAYREFGSYDDCGSFYREEVIKAEQHLETLIAVKIKLEKHWRKLKHQLNDTNE